MTAEDIAREILERQPPIDRPVITRCLVSSHGLPSFCDGTPYIEPENLELFLGALRNDIALMSVEPAKRIFRKIDKSEPYPIPESCTPFLDANGLGYYLAPYLPIVFVRNRRGEPILEARTALKYLRENESQFSSVLRLVESYSHRVFRDDAQKRLQARYTKLVSNIAQPYSSFTGRHVAFRAGLWAQTPPGIVTLIGPLVNQRSLLPVVTGAVDTDWHHFELFVVTEFPEFEGQVHVIEPDTAIAQLYFVSRAAQSDATIRFSTTDPGADPEYAEKWNLIAERLVTEGRAATSERSGVASVDLGCPHCFVSVTRAAEESLPPDHVLRRGFNSAYKILQRQHRASFISSSSKTGGEQV